MRNKLQIIEVTVSIDQVLKITTKFTELNKIIFSLYSNISRQMDSDQEIFDMEQRNPEIVDEVIEKKPKLDKRAATSRANLAKARAAKIALLKQQKQEKLNTYNVYESASDSDDTGSESEQELVIQKKSKPRQIPAQKGKGYNETPRYQSNSSSELSELKTMMAHILKAQMKAKKKPLRKQINVQLQPAYAPNQPHYAPKQSNPKMESLTRTLINL